MSDPLFVYGTLKRGESNHGLIAGQVTRIEPAWVHGLLYDFGAFPALVPGPGRVYGELLWLDPGTGAAIVDVLDELEGYDPEDEGASLYWRREVTAWREGKTLPAWTYVLNTDRLVHLGSRIVPVPSGHWSGPAGQGAAAPGN